MVTAITQKMELRYPYSKDIENSLLFAILTDKDVADNAINQLKKEYFYYKYNSELFEIIKSIYDETKVIDSIILSSKLLKTHETYLLQEILTQPIVNVINVNNIQYYIQILIELYTKREVLSKIRDTIPQLCDSEKDISETLINFDIAINDIIGNAIFADVTTLSDTVVSIVDSFNEPTDFLQTGFHELDFILGGLYRGDSIIIAGRPSQGKTAFALAIALNIAKTSPVLFISLEMSKNQLGQRALAMYSSVPMNNLRRKHIEDDKIHELIEVVKDLNSRKFYVVDSVYSLDDIIALSHKYRRKYGVELIVIDYLGLIRSEAKNTREQEIAIISRRIKQLAKTLNIPIITLSQLNRSPETRQDKKPMLSDLRESGAIEQDADVVMFVYRPEFYGIEDIDGQSTENLAQIIVAKQRNGAIGTAQLYFNKEHVLFQNITTTQQIGF